MTSDPIPIPLAALLSEARWLEGLARALAADREEARDLVQDVWVAAAEHAPARVERPRAWLATVLRNALRSRKRSVEPRERRERASARAEASPGAADVVSRAEAQRTLVEHVLALDEPWRSTVLLRFFDGLSSEAIARREGLPASTVRNRVAHALGLLRARLERTRGTKWMEGLAPLIGLSPTTVGAGTVIGGVLMGTGAKVTLAAAVAAAATWWSWRALAAGPTDVRGSEELAELTSEVADGLEAITVDRREPLGPGSANGPSSTAVAPATPAEPPLPAGTLELVVLEDGEPCARPGMLEIAPDWVPFAKPASAEPEGLLRRPQPSVARFQLAGLTPGRFGLWLAIEAGPTVGTTVVLPAARGVRHVLQLGSAAIEGTVWDESGAPVPGARIGVSWRAGPFTPNHRATSDENGRYRLARLAAGEWFGTLELPSGEEVHFVVTLARSEARRLDFGLPRPWPVWRGTLRTRTGAEHRGGAWLELRDPGGVPALVRRPVDEDGRFELRLVPGTYRVEAGLWDHDSFRAQLGEVVIGPDGLERDLVLPGATLRGQVHAARPDLDLALDRRDPLQIGVRREGHDYPAAVRGTQVDVHGAFAIDALEPGVYLVNGYPLPVAGGRDSLRVEILPGQDELVLDVFLDRP